MNDLRQFSIDRIKPLPQLRDKQQEVIEKSIDAFKSKKFVILEAPTGFGKCQCGNQKIKIRVSKKLYKLLNSKKL